MQSVLFERIAFLYGDDIARGLLPRLEQMIRVARAGTRRQAGAIKTELSEREVLLITYPDQVHEAGVRPIVSLNAFLTQHLFDSISGVHLLPFYPSSSDDGFSVIDYRAVDPMLGDWEDVARLGQSFDLMFDAVINHASARSEWFKHFLLNDPAYSNYFISVSGKPDLSRVVRPRTSPVLTSFPTAAGEKKVWTTFSADQIDLNYHDPDVLVNMLDTLLFYVQQGARFIRLDAIAYLWKEIGTSCIHLPQTHAIIQIIRAVLDKVAPWVQLITETNVPHSQNISYFGNGDDEAQLVYNFALPPLVLHALAKGDASVLSSWAQTLELPSRRTTFFNFLASHDGIGVTPLHGILNDGELDTLIKRTRARGGYVSFKQGSDGASSPYELNINYLDALSEPNEPLDTLVDRYIAAQAIMLSLIGVPGIYFHSFFGSRGDRNGAEASGIPRRINRQKFSRPELERDLADPNSLRTRVLTRFAELVRIRRSHAAFHPHGKQRVIETCERVYAVERIAPDDSERMLCVHNLTNAPVSCRVPNEGEDWVDQLSSKRIEHTVGGYSSIELQPYQVVWALPITMAHLHGADK